MLILAVNAGSSSIKSALFEMTTLPEGPTVPLWKAEFNWNKTQEGGTLRYKSIHSEEVKDEFTSITPQKAFVEMFKTLWSGKDPILFYPSQVDIVGHRYVNGGSAFKQDVLITEEVLEQLESLSFLAPLHNPVNLEGIKVARHLFGGSRQFAIFDTVFHADLPLHAKIYPGPYEWYEKGIYRYGFHGINLQYAALRAAKLLEKPILSLKMCICHLGAGSSLCAVKEGKSVDTTMGFTPLEGVMMTTRSGTVDPGILLYLAREEKASFERIDHTLNKESGLLGVSGISDDLREILKARKSDDRAELAIRTYIHRLCREIGGMICSMEGIDVLVFTGGIGENAPSIREEACQRLAFLGVSIDIDKNQRAGKEDVSISSASSKISIMVIHAQEEWQIASASSQKFLTFETEH